MECLDKLAFCINLVVKYNYTGIFFGDKTAKLLWLVDDECVESLIKGKEGWTMIRFSITNPGAFVKCIGTSDEQGMEWLLDIVTTTELRCVVD